ncbi:MAG: TMEM165/GDT1 family protein [Spirochaetes bacterium]|nr:TMEM165/GDT1 family protein [Spirochaetota bacterium]
MNKFKLFISTFLLIFLAELGDKTQIASFSMAAGSGNVVSVMIGASLALIASTLFAVLFGQLITKMIDRKVLKIISSVLFIITGFYLLYNTLLPYFLKIF